MKLKYITSCIIAITFHLHALYAAQNNVIDLQRSINKEYGIIEHIHTAQEDRPWVLLLRDAHFNINAQYNSAAILNQLSEYKLIDALYVEGASGSLNTDIIRLYPHNETRNEVANYLLKKSYINGVEYFTTTLNCPVIPEGIEDPETYIDNLAYLQKIIDNQKMYSSFAHQILNFVKTNKDYILSEELRNFENWREQYQSNQLSLAQFCTKLLTAAKINRSRYPNISLLLESDKLLQQIDQQVLSLEETRALSYLSGILSDDALQNLFKQRVTSHIGHDELNSFYSNLLSHIDELDAQQQYHSIIMYTHVLDMQAKIDLQALDEEHYALEKHFIALVAKTNCEQSIYQLEEQAYTLQSFFNLSMTAKEAQTFLNHHNQYTLQSLTELAATINNETPLSITDQSGTYSKALKTVTQFYRLAITRDTILARNMINKIETDNIQYAVVFAGGFHTPGMIEYCINHNINIAVIKPMITSDIAIEKSPDYTDSFITNQTNIEKFISRVINAIAIPRWLSDTPVGISENQKNIKMIETASYLMALHAEHILQGDRNKASSEVIEIVNTALHMTGIKRFHNIALQEIRRYPQYREYELRINGESIFFYFAHRNDEFLWKTVTEDMQSILADPTLFTDSLLMSVAQNPIELIAVPARSQNDILTDTFITWAQDHTLATTQTTKLTLPEPAIITTSRDAETLVISLVSLDRETKEKKVVYQERVPDSGISGDFIVRLTQSIRTTFAPRFSISPRIIVIQPNTDESELLEASLFSQQQSPLKSHLKKRFSEKESFSDFPFETTATEQQTITDAQLIEKFIRHAQRQNSFASIIAQAGKASSKRLLTILSSPDFFVAMEKITHKKTSYIRTRIINNLLNNTNTPPTALVNILQLKDFHSLITHKTVLPTFRKNPLYAIVTHKSTNDTILDLLADHAIKITSQHHSMLTRWLTTANRYIPMYRIMDNLPVYILIKLNLLPKYIADFFKTLSQKWFYYP